MNPHFRAGELARGIINGMYGFTCKVGLMGPISMALADILDWAIINAREIQKEGQNHHCCHKQFPGFNEHPHFFSVHDHRTGVSCTAIAAALSEASVPCNAIERMKLLVMSLMHSCSIPVTRIMFCTEYREARCGISVSIPIKRK